MVDVSNLTNRVIEQERSIQAVKLEEVKIEQEQYIKEQRDVISRQVQQQKERVDHELSNERAIAENNLANQKRDRVLAHKQDIVTDYYEKVKEGLLALDSNHFKQLIQSVLSQFDGKQQLELILGEASQDLVDAAWVQDQLASQVTLSQEVVPGQGGFVLKKDSYQYNYLFDDVIEEAKAELLNKLVAHVFN